MDEVDKYHKLPNEIEYEGMLLNGKLMFPEVMAKYHEIDTTEKDIILATYPKCGTTWISEILYLLRAESDKVAASKSSTKRHIFLDLTMPGAEESVTLTKRRHGEARTMMTHLPARFVNKQIEEGKAKIIVVMRNPKDMLVSFFHFYRMNALLGNFGGSWNDFFELFKNKGLLFGDWLKFNKSYWPHRTKENVMFVVYEEVKRDTKKCIRELAAFLNVSCTQEDIETISQLVDFNHMKGNNAVNHKDSSVFKKDANFMRKGKSGGWKEVFTVAQSEYVDSLYEGECKRLGIPIIYK